MTDIIRDFDPAKGQAFQGDIAIVPVPEKIAKLLDRSDPLNPAKDGRVILQEGEVSGHHHAVALLDRPERVKSYFSKEAEKVMADALAGKIALPSAKLYRDPALVSRMMQAEILTRSDLCVGFLEVETGPMTIVHEEHDGIRLPVGLYYIGRQVEQDAQRERIVAD